MLLVKVYIKQECLVITKPRKSEKITMLQVTQENIKSIEDVNFIEINEKIVLHQT